MNLDYDFDRAERNSKIKKFVVKSIGWILAIGVTVGLAYVISTYVLEKTNMADKSMNTTLSVDDKILINKLLYKIREPERFDVIVFKKDGKEHSYYSIKRVVGLPGETVQIRDGYVYINGELLEEPMVVDAIYLEGLAAEELVLDDDEYFVLGDNRNDSEDSRFANVGNVTAGEIVGKAWIRTNKFGIISKLNMNSKSEETEE